MLAAASPGLGKTPFTTPGWYVMLESHFGESTEYGPYPDRWNCHREGITHAKSQQSGPLPSGYYWHCEYLREARDSGGDS
jgi:hypothetical protein